MKEKDTNENRWKVLRVIIGIFWFRLNLSSPGYSFGAIRPGFTSRKCMIPPVTSQGREGSPSPLKEPGE